MRGIGSSVYYPQPVPRMKYYRNKYGYDNKKFLNAAYMTTIALQKRPSEYSDMKIIVKEFNECADKIK